MSPSSCQLLPTEIASPELVIVRCGEGMDIEVGGADQVVHTQHVDAIFFLVSPEADPGMHLRLLASIAIAVEQPKFKDRWRSAAGPAGLKASLLRHERSLDVRLSHDDGSTDWIDHLQGRVVFRIALDAGQAHPLPC